jgi:hypothetical protein
MIWDFGLSRLDFFYDFFTWVFSIFLNSLISNRLVILSWGGSIILDDGDARW